MTPESLPERLADCIPAEANLNTALPARFPRGALKPPVQWGVNTLGSRALPRAADAAHRPEHVLAELKHGSLV